MATDSRLRNIGALFTVSAIVSAACGGSSRLALSPTAASSLESSSAGGIPSPTSQPAESAAVSAPPAATPAIDVSRFTGRIVFTRAGGDFGDDTVFVADATGANEAQVRGRNEICCPRFAPDGNEIAVPWSDPDGQRITTAILRLDGSIVRVLPLPKGPLSIAEAAFSLDGTELALRAWDDANPAADGIYIRRATDGGDLRRVVTKSASVVDFSPDKKTIYLFSAVPTFPSIGDQRDGSLWGVNVDGSELRQITPDNVPVENVGSPGRVSPDGKWIVFTSLGVIWKIHADGSELTRVFADGAKQIAITPTWSPDGRFIAFGLDPAGSRATAETPPNNSLDVILSDGSGLTPLISSPDWKREPEWKSAG